MNFFGYFQKNRGNRSNKPKDVDKILFQKFKPYQVKHVEDQKQVVEGFVNSLEMQKFSISNFWLDQ